jgi:two-component system C4-dicarboxylate transport response regulator DctD
MFDAVVSDVHMPGSSGIALLKWVRDLCPDVPVILMSGFRPDSAVTHAQRAGAFEYLSKPFRGATLLSTLERAFTQSVEAIRSVNTRPR